MDWDRGCLVPLVSPGLPVGQIVSYEDRSNPRNEFVVVSSETNQRRYTQSQPVICLADGHSSEISMAGGKITGHWTVTPRIMPADELAIALAAASDNKIRIAAEHKVAAERKAQQQATERADLMSKYGRKLEMVKPGQYASAALGSKNIKRELGEAFPGIKFSVRSDNYSGGCSIDIYWELGPTTDEVKKITDKYQEGHFNGMDDIYESDRDNQWPDLFGGAKYVFEHRSDSTALNIVAAALCDAWKLTPPADGKSWWQVRRPDDSHGHDLGVIARQIIMAQSYPAGAVITGIESAGADAGGSWSDIYRCTYTTPAAAPVALYAESAPVGGSLDIAVKFNAEKHGIEISFAAKPSASVLSDLKAHGWRWSRFSSCWYQRASTAAAQFAGRLVNMSADELQSLLGKIQRTEPDRFDMQVEDNMAAACGL